MTEQERKDLEMVKQNGFDLKYVKNQTETVCLEAVKQNGYALQYVKNQTEEICLAAVIQDGWALDYVINQTERVCLEALKQVPTGRLMQFIDNNTIYFDITYYKVLDEYINNPFLF